jgi:thiamine biosynthesis lipoprotein
MHGRVDRTGVSADLAEVLELCEVITELSGGAFDIRRHRTDGLPDPTGLVKGWAVDRAADILTAGGIERFSLGAGGDVVVRGGRSPWEPWRIGIVDPTDRARVVATLVGRDLAVATSGQSERGEHIVDGRTGAPPDGLSSLSVAGPRLAHADAYATAAFAMGTAGLRWCASLPGYGACALTVDRRLLATDALFVFLDPAPS